MSDDRPYTGIVLAGGASARLGRDKTRIAVGGRSALERVLAALGDAAELVIVGEPRATERPDVVWTQEQPPGGGPAAGVAAAVALVSAPWAVVLAGDLPMVDGTTVHRLLAAAGDTDDGAVLVDAGGRRQHLSVALRATALRQRSAGHDWHGAPMWSLLDGLSLTEVAAQGHETLDLDEPGDVHTARLLAGEPERTPMSDRSQLPEWTAAAVADLGLDIEVDLKLVLDLARDAAHAVERPAAPVTTYLLGVAAAKRSPGEGVRARDVEALSEQLTRLAQQWAAERG